MQLKTSKQGNLTMLDKYVSIIWAIIKNPYEYFLSDMPKDNSVRDSLVFAVIISSVSSIIYLIAISATMEFGLFALLMSFIFLPIMTLVFLYFCTFGTHSVIFMFCPRRSTFKQTLKVLAYSSATNVLLVIPVIGSFLMIIFQTRAIIFGLSAVHNVSALKLFMFLIIIPIVVVTAIIVLLIVAFWDILMPYYYEILSSF
jgi:hypothetical protein